jgi:hypothetical protein
MVRSSSALEAVSNARWRRRIPSVWSLAHVATSPSEPLYCLVEPVRCLASLVYLFLRTNRVSSRGVGGLEERGYPREQRS